MGARRVRETGEESAHGVEEEWDAFSGGQSLREVGTVADRLASLSFQERQSNRVSEEHQDLSLLPFPYYYYFSGLTLNIQRRSLQTLKEVGTMHRI